MAELYDAANEGNFERVKILVEQGVDINQLGGKWRATALSYAASKDHVTIVQYLVEQGADIEYGDGDCTPLITASSYGSLRTVRYLLEQGANRDKADIEGWTSLHCAAHNDYLETAKLLMIYGADLNARTDDGESPIDVTFDEEIKQAIRDEPRRRMDEAPGKRATEEDRHPNAVASASAQQEEDEDGETQSNKKPRLDCGVEAEAGKVAEENEDSEPSDEEDDY